MVDLVKSGMGTVAFLLGYFIMLITLYTIPPLANYLGDTLAGIIWFGLILIWVLATLVIPVGLMVWGVMIPSQNDNPVFNMAMGVVWLLLGCAFTYFSYYMTSTFSSMLTASISGVTYTLPAVLFWIGLIAVWIFNIGVIPTYFIIESRK